MLRIRPLTFLLALTTLLLSSQSSMARDCFGSLRKPLTEGGYSGSLDCKEVHVAIKKIGSISAESGRYTVYYLRYVTIPDFPGAQPHGGQKILVFSGTGAKTYLGQYPFTLYPVPALRIVGTSLVMDYPSNHGNEIRFTENGPPRQAFFADDLIPLER